jgi:hypothetical protein
MLTAIANNGLAVYLQYSLLIAYNSVDVDWLQRVTNKVDLPFHVFMLGEFKVLVSTTYKKYDLVTKLT